MGAKHLKAVAVTGNRKTTVAHPDAIKTLLNDIREPMKVGTAGLKDRHAQTAFAEASDEAGYTVFAPPLEAEEPADNPPVVAETRVDIPTAAVSDAVLQLELGGWLQALPGSRWTRLR